MDALLIDYTLFLHLVRMVLFGVAVVSGLIALVDWLVRTRRISPFNAVGRFFRRSVEPLMVPVERAIVRAGGQPASAPWWSLVAVVVGGVVLISVLEFVGGLLVQLSRGINNPRALPIILLSWVFKLGEFALIVRVLSSWLPIPPYSRWIRWTYPLTNWILVPLRRVIPLLGMIDITPVVAYLLLAWIFEPTVLRLVGAAMGV